MSLINALVSPEKLFQQEAEIFKNRASLHYNQFSVNEINSLPMPLQKYMNYCAYPEKQIFDLYEVIWSKSAIKMAPEKNWMKLKTLQYNFIPEPARIAWMKTWMMGLLPFEGRDKYFDGQGHMYGTLAKVIRIFDAKETEIAQSALIVILAESLLLPAYALQSFINWESAGSNMVKGVLTHRGIRVEGLFHFNDKGEYIRFTTGDRFYSGKKGSFLKIPYTVEVNNYQENNGVKIPTEVCAIWNLPEGDFEYWKGSISQIRGIG